MIRADIVTVFHNDDYYELHLKLFDAIKRAEPEGGVRLIGVDNRKVNRGFAAACNLGALLHPDAKAPMIGFLNPDISIDGSFIDKASANLRGGIVITGCRFDKPDHELAAWGVRNWVCGAALFVQRQWFTAVGGFDERFVWSWEETDLIRQAEAQNLHCRSIDLPIRHDQLPQSDEKDAAYKSYYFTQGERRYRAKWRRR
jgi:GT2 family glycosyltransferase